MRWFAHHWGDYDAKNKVNFVNPYATKICFGLYIPMMFVWFIKRYVIPPTPERKNQVWFKVFTMIANVLPLFSIIIGIYVAKNIININPNDD